MLDLNSIVVTDVSNDEEKLRLAQSLVAESYARFCTRPLCVNEVLQELCNDIYQQQKVVRTFLMTGQDEEYPEKPIILSTNRIVLGSLANNLTEAPPFEVMDLVTPLGGWESFDFAGFGLAQAGEIGRYTIADPYRGQSYTHLIFQQLMEKSIQISRERFGVQQFWAIMPKYVVRQLESIGFKVIPVPTLRLNTEKHAAYFAKYKRYWYHSKPWFYRIIPI